jgi:hypothetical protein
VNGCRSILAARVGEARIAETAITQIKAAAEVLRQGGNAAGAKAFEGQLSRAGALHARLLGR